MSYLGNLIPVLVYGIVCACLGALVYTAYLNHWRKP